jgi:hypothetical protein
MTGHAGFMRRALALAYEGMEGGQWRAVWRCCCEGWKDFGEGITACSPPPTRQPKQR